MLRLDKVIKPWKESAAFNDHINLYGFWSETAFLTKSEDLGMVVVRVGSRVRGFKPGDQVYARPPQDRIGSFAELMKAGFGRWCHLGRLSRITDKWSLI